MSVSQGVTEAIRRLRLTPPAELLACGTLTVEAVTREYGLGRSAVYGLMAAGLPFAKVNDRRLIPRRAITELLAVGLTGVEAAG